MSDSDFDQVFGRRPEGRGGFVDRLGQPLPFGGRNDPAAAMALEIATSDAAPGTYKAFGYIPAGTINQSCEVRRWMDGTGVPDGVVFFYRLLMRIAYTGTNELKLMLPDSIIVVTGQNLEPLREALTRHLVTYVQQFSPRVWNAQQSKTDTLIQHIDFVHSK